MKTYITIGFLLLNLLVAANPCPPPQVYINELKPNAGSDWVMELRTYYLLGNYIDSICVQSGSGTATYTGHSCPTLLFHSMLNRPLYINPLGDVVAVTVYRHSFVPVSAGVRFGNVSDPWIFSPLPNQTIARTHDAYTWDCSYTMSLDNSPSMGQINDTAGMCSSLSGKIYDKDGRPVCNQWLYLDYPFLTGPDGDFTTRVFSRIYTWSRISYFNGRWYDDMEITPVSYALYPDSAITRDIHLLDTLISGIPGKEKNRTVMKIYPNPVHDRLTVSLDYDLSNPVFDISLTILDLSGRVVKTVKVASAVGTVSIPAGMGTGTYIARLDGDGKVLETRRFVVQ